ncbi:MAG: MFS transporter, partial [Candidatus Omnitrophica bacterium]|nr:MFS transporter [Candidatus Omnitrophota bacterium]
SGLGRMLGYTGAIIALYLIKPVVLKGGLQAAFLPTGMLFLLFSLPCLLFIKDRAPKSKVSFLLFTSKNKLLVSLKQLKSDFTNSHSIPLVPNFLKSAFLGLCVVNVIILFMSVYATRVFQLNEAQIVQLVTFSTFFAIFGSFLCGFLSDYIRIRPGLIGIFILWSLSLYLGSILRSGSALFLLVGALVGFSLGATWVVLRAFTLRLVPAERVGALFGLFNLIGSLSALTGALFWGVILLFLSPFGDTGYRIALLSLNIFFAFAVVFALRIKEK